MLLTYLIKEDGITERPSLEWLRTYIANSTVNVQDKVVKSEVIIYSNPVVGGVMHLSGLISL